MGRILLVSMPFGSTKWPSAGLGLLQAILAREGIPCDCRYLNFLLACRISIEPYEHICTYTSDTLVGEWIFAKALFAERIPSLETYALQVVFPSVRNSALGPPWDKASASEIENKTTAWIGLLREQAQSFLEECLQSVAWEEYDLVGFTTSFQQNLASLALAYLLKQRYPAIRIVFGGANCEGEMGLALHRLFPAVDFVCRGEADTTFPLLAKAVLKGEPVTDIPGMLHRVNGNTVLPGREAETIADLDQLPFPDYSTFVEQRAQYLPDAPPPQLLIETGRGCWWGEKSQCTFCGLNGESLKYRGKSPDRAVQELTHLKKRYGICKISASDNIINRQYFTSLFPRLAALHLDIELFYETKANLRKAQVKLLREAGVLRIQPGIESLSTRILQRMRKGVSASQNVQLLRWCAEYNITPVWNILAGFPDEEPAEYTNQSRLVPLLFHLPPPSGAAIVRLDRYSPLFSCAGRNGISRVRPKAAYEYVYPFEKHELFKLAYSFDFDYRDERDPGAYLECLSNVVTAWTQMYDRCLLSSLSRNGALYVFDTRPVAGVQCYSISGFKRLIYEYCDSARSYEDIEEHAKKHFPDMLKSGDLVHMLDELVEQKLLVKLDRKYLILSVSADYQALLAARYLAAGLSPPKGVLPLIERLYGLAPELVLEVCGQIISGMRRGSAPEQFSDR